MQLLLCLMEMTYAVTTTLLTRLIALFQRLISFFGKNLPGLCSYGLTGTNVYFILNNALLQQAALFLFKEEYNSEQQEHLFLYNFSFSRKTILFNHPNRIVCNRIYAC